MSHQTLWFGALAAALAWGPPEAPAAAPPNLVVILADDMGFSDAGCYGGEIATPNLDRLADGGLRFTQFYNTARCWPSRAALLTGYYAQQVRRDTLPGVPSGGNGVRPRWARLLPALLKPLGYRTYHSGKWHVDGPVLAGGFDRSYSLNDQDRHFNPRQHTLDDRPLPAVEPGSGYYSTTAITQHALDMLDEHRARHRGEPFFLYLAFTVPHFPLHAPPEDIALYRDRYRAGWDALRAERYGRMKGLGLVNCALSKLDPDIIPSWNFPEQKLRELIGPGEVARAVPWEGLTAEQKGFQPVKMAIHAAMVHRMDTEIGRVLDRLRAMDVLDDTVVLFLSDNGASAEEIVRGDGHDRAAAPGSARTYLSIGPGWSSAANTPFRLHKSWVHEGGITTPLIVHWPRGIAARGELRHNPGHLVDLAPTLLELAGGKFPDTFDGKPLPPAPGKSLVPVFTRDGSVAHDYFWWYHENNRAVRVGDWKLVSAGKGAPWELYDLRTDRCEMNDLAGRQPDRVRALEKVWQAHLEEFRALATQDLPREGGARDRQAAPDRKDEAVPCDTTPPLVSLYLPIPLGVPGVEKQETGVFVPANYRAGETVDLVVFLRGYDIRRPKAATSVAEYWNSPQHPILKSFLLREEVNRSGKNVILVVPTLGPFAEAGKLQDGGGAREFLDGVLDGLWRSGPHAGLAKRPAVRHLILAAHSGGGVALRRLAQVLGDDDEFKGKLKACWGFDSIYGVKDRDAEFWSDWAGAHPGTRVTMFYLFTEKEVGKDPRLPVSAANPLDHREPTGTTFPAMELERLARARMLANVTLVRETRASTLSHTEVPRAHLADLLKEAAYLDDR